MDDWSADARGVLDDARGADDPSHADRARIDRKMAARLGAAALVTSGVVASSAPASATTVLGVGSALGVKVAVALVVAAAATGGGFAAWHGLRAQPARAERASHGTSVRDRVQISPRIASGPRAPEPTPVVAVAPVAPVARVAPLPAAPVIGAFPAGSSPGELHVRHVVASAHVAPAPVALVDTLADQNRMFTEAQAALHGHQPARALEAVDRYAASYPRGEHAEASGALRVMALCALHRDDDARAARAAFERAWPGSAYSARFAAACSEPEPTR